MAGGVAADLRRWFFPAADGLGGLGGLAVVQTKRAEHALGVKEQQVRRVPGLVGLERAGEEFDILQGQGGGAARGAVGSVAGRVRVRWRGLSLCVRLRCGDGGNLAGDQRLLGDQQAGPGTEDGQCPAPAQAAASPRGCAADVTGCLVTHAF